MDVGGIFVGRARELDLLSARLDDARGGRGQLVLVAGEPGIGKTRLAEELGRHAEAVGVPLGWGRASEDEGSPPYWIFRQLARSAGRAMPGLLTGGAGDGGSAEARFEAFEALADDLRAAAEAQGLLLVLDDLQWADAASLALLVHLARGIGRSRLMIVATYRDTETTGREALSSALPAFARESSLTRVRLVGLTQAEVERQLKPRHRHVRAAGAGRAGQPAHGREPVLRRGAGPAGRQRRPGTARRCPGHPPGAAGAAERTLPAADRNGCRAGQRARSRDAG